MTIEEKEIVIREFVAWCKTKEIRLAGSTFSFWLGTDVVQFLAEEDEPNLISDYVFKEEEGR